MVKHWNSKYNVRQPYIHTYKQGAMKNELIFVCVFLPFGWGEQECARYTEGVFLYELLFVCVFIPIRREKHNQSKTCFSRIALFFIFL